MRHITLSKADQSRVKKLADALYALKEGREHYFSITKLTSIKTLCKTSDIATQFAFYLSKLTLKKVDSSTSCPKYTDPKDWEMYKKAIKKSVKLMCEFIENSEEKNLTFLREFLHEVRSMQNKTRPGPYGSVIRTIYSKDLLVIEDAIYCILDAENCSHWAYKLTRDYTEKYNPHYGTGLISESIPMLGDIILFWMEGDQNGADLDERG